MTAFCGGVFLWKDRNRLHVLLWFFRLLLLFVYGRPLGEVETCYFGYMLNLSASQLFSLLGAGIKDFVNRGNF